MGDADGFKEFLQPPGEFAISGSNSQVISYGVKKGEKLVSEPGTMFYMSPDVGVGAECAPGAFQRCCCMAESCFQIVFENKDKEDPQYVGLTPSFPAKVIAVDLKADMNGAMTVKPGGYMGNIGNAELELDCDCCSSTCCCGGMGCCRQKIHGDGTAFLAAGGTIMEK